MGYLICKKCTGYYQLQEGESPEDFRECQCGGKLVYSESIEKNKKLRSNVKLTNKSILRISGTLFGSVIMLLPYYFFSVDPTSASFVYNNTTSPLLWCAGGFLAAFIAGGKIKSGISNGFYVAVIAGLLVIIFFYFMTGNYFNSNSQADNIAFFLALLAVYLFVPAIFSIVGGLIGIITRKILTKLY